MPDRCPRGSRRKDGVCREYKEEYEWVIESYYDGQYGWEEVTAEDNRSEARQRLKEYRENEPQYSHRMRFKTNKVWGKKVRGRRR